MRYAHTLVSLCLFSLVVLTACQDDSAMNPVDSPNPEVDATGPAPPTFDIWLEEVEGYPTPGETRTGFIYDQYGAPLEVTYEIHDGLAIWQGDIVIGTPDRIATSAAELAGSENGALLGVVISGAGFRWPGGVVPFENGLTTGTNRVPDAIAIIENQTPGVTFVPRNGEADFVRFVPGSGCSSAIGRQGGQQDINLADGCTTGNTAHEILHALGMYHEHTRCDRHLFVTIDYDEIESGREHNFWKAGAGNGTDNCSGAFDIDAYDFGSMMHYPFTAFNIGTDPTIIPIVDVPPGVVVGQRSQVGPTDAETIHDLYGAFNAAPTVVFGPLESSYPEGSSVPFNAAGSTDADDDDDLLTFEWTFGDGPCTIGCSDPAPPHKYFDNGTFAYSVTISDGFDSGTDGGSIIITNVAPSVDAGADVTIDEGDEYTRSGSFMDPGDDTWAATVDYGDGSGAQLLALSGKDFSLAHTYIDNGLNTVMVTVTDDDGGVGSDDAEVTVNNVAPTVDAGPDATMDSGETYALSGTFTDPGIDDDPWSWLIEWGFGPDTEGSTNDQSAPIEASRQVCAAGEYTVRLTVTDKDGGAGMDELILTVPYIPVDIDIMPGTDLNPVNLGKKGNLPVAILGSVQLDVAQVDPATLVLGDETGSETPIGQKNNGTYEAYMEDVDSDGMMDLVVMFPTDDLVANGELTELSTDLVLRGFLLDGCTNIRGADLVTPRTR